jgi:TPR repeat protein
MGWKYYKKHEYNKSFSWFMRAAEQGYAPGESDLAWSYLSGAGVSENHNTATMWYAMAAEQGNAEAQYRLGAIFSAEDVDPFSTKEYVLAAYWYRKAAMQGDPRAQSNLGLLLEGERPDAPQDLVQAYMWFSLAVSSVNSDPVIVSVRRTAAHERDKISRHLSQPQIAEAYRLGADISRQPGYSSF